MSVMACDPSLLALERAGAPARPPGAAELDEMRRSREVYGYVTDVTLMATDGWSGNPGWATRVRAESFAGTVAEEVVQPVETVLRLQDRPRSMPAPPGGKEES